MLNQTIFFLSCYYDLMKAIFVDRHHYDRCFLHVSRFLCFPSGKEQRSHSCGLHAAQEGLGYQDLNELQQDMKPLDFEFELVKVEEANTYEKELWQMSPEEMMASVPR